MRDFSSTLKHLSPQRRVHHFTNHTRKIFPPSLDYRLHGATGPLRFQDSSCMSCYAHVTADAIGASVWKKTGTFPRFSAQQIIDCTRPSGNLGCNGGNMPNAYTYLSNGSGVALESCYPWLGTENNCLDRTLDSSCFTAKLDGFLTIPVNDEEALVSALIDYGPIGVGINAKHWSFGHYQSGIYSPSKCAPSSVSHAMLLVGYDVDPETGTKYWILKNTWGERWGVDGYISSISYSFSSPHPNPNNIHRTH
ncbi:putative Procathepsin L [Blattamonas nauphoetae]|uniref:Procathepsin L n=1 Tax=Blattamonas nauphoetae TaxID=2049346 RepID=A0ABQ9X9U1_9EUKA|nr:putative Procathepsin L [Blattamonas nauphoetae]